METLIILHGWQSSGERWQKVKKIIEDNDVQVFCPDIPGFKPETELKEPWNLDNYIGWFKEYMKSVELEEPDISDRFFLLGHSFGGRMAIKIASQNLFNFKGLILVSAAGIKKQPSLGGKAMGLGAKLVKAFKLGDLPLIKNVYNFLRIFFYHYIIKKTDYLNAKGNLNETIKNILDEDLFFKLEKISVPTKIIWGEKDNYTPLSDGYFMKEKIKNSELEIFKDIKHMPYLECPKKLAESITEFIKKQ
jgi:pimeloyl-ACP methyl ester carboxylesterase